MKFPDGWIAAQRDAALAIAELAVRKAELQREAAGTEARSRCQHSVVAEAPYYSSNYGSSLPPFRVCLGCGLRERGWGCGYHALADESNRMVVDLSRDAAYPLATEQERISGWWIIPCGKTELPDPYLGYPDK